MRDWTRARSLLLRSFPTNGSHHELTNPRRTAFHGTDRMLRLSLQRLVFCHPGGVSHTYARGANRLNFFFIFLFFLSKNSRLNGLTESIYKTANPEYASNTLNTNQVGNGRKHLRTKWHVKNNHLMINSSPEKKKRLPMQLKSISFAYFGSSASSRSLLLRGSCDVVKVN